MGSVRVVRRVVGVVGVVAALLVTPGTASAAFNVTVSTGANTNGSFTGGVFTPTGSGANINVTTLVNELTVNNVTITTGVGGVEAGNVRVSRTQCHPPPASHSRSRPQEWPTSMRRRFRSGVARHSTAQCPSAQT